MPFSDKNTGKLPALLLLNRLIPVGRRGIEPQHLRSKLTQQHIELFSLLIVSSFIVINIALLLQIIVIEYYLLLLLLILILSLFFIFN